jgi:hypothetical protein
MIREDLLNTAIENTLVAMESISNFRKEDQQLLAAYQCLVNARVPARRREEGKEEVIPERLRETCAKQLRRDMLEIKK